MSNMEKVPEVGNYTSEASLRSREWVVRFSIKLWNSECWVDLRSHFL